MLISPTLNVKLKTNEKMNRKCRMNHSHIINCGEKYWKIWDATKRNSYKSFCLECFEKTKYKDLYNEEKEKRDANAEQTNTEES